MVESYHYITYTQTNCNTKKDNNCISFCSFLSMAVTIQPSQCCSWSEGPIQQGNTTAGQSQGNPTRRANRTQSFRISQNTSYE